MQVIKDRLLSGVAALHEPLDQHERTAASTVESEMGIEPDDTAFERVDLDRVMSYAAWRKRVGLSKDTAKRLRDDGAGPRLTYLSGRLLGVRERDHLAWLETRTLADDGRAAVRLVERRLVELGRAVEAGRLDRRKVVLHLAKVAAKVGLVAEPTAA